MDEVLYGQDLDGSGDMAKMRADVENAPQYAGAAGVSSLRYAHTAPEHRVDTNTRIDTTYADEAGVKAARPHGEDGPIREPLKQARAANKFQKPELFSKAGVAGWVNSERAPGKAPGKDEAWRPWHNQGKWFYSG